MLLALMTVALLITPADHFATGRVVDVHDGDTMIILIDGIPTAVELAGIDAPELGQSFGVESRQSLSALCIGRYAGVYNPSQNDVGRTVASVLCAGEDAAAHQVDAGMAKAEDSSLNALEEAARMERRGIWSRSRQ